MYENISDDKVDLYCDDRLAAIEDLDFVLNELKKLSALKQRFGRDDPLGQELGHLRMGIAGLITRFDETLKTEDRDVEGLSDIEDVCYTCWEAESDCECSEGFDNTLAREKSGEFDEGQGPRSVQEILNGGEWLMPK